ncbi:DNA-directed RNA polymerase I subunit RPA2-like [Ylistrum balloti]|uniref:DNA-directed RNA polymerase I subunit RPA2-like n=1 Tax=Ylistrum balloti TaxID=509963 RepID=UPI0029059F75|nr:DNA-directed RNA polymerase I subunit RPA2-like [Ylistrum balloti]
MSTEGSKQPSFKNLTTVNYAIPKEYQHLPLQELTKPHVESFNFFLKEGLSTAVKNIPSTEFALPNGDRVRFKVLDATLYQPRVAQGNNYAVTQRVYPAECRERGVTYKGSLKIQLMWSVNDNISGTLDKEIGTIPIMVKSDGCNLSKLSPADLIKRGEEAEEMGGYFVVNGLEKVVRMLVMPRRNYPTCMTRPSWKNRGKQYTEYGVSIRCVLDDQSGITNILHYLSNGMATLSFTYNKEMFFVPVMFILKALLTVTDKYIYDELIQGKEDDTYYKGCMVAMLRQAQDEGLLTQSSILKLIGERFRIKLDLPVWYSDTDVARYLLKHCIAIHLDSNTDKFNLLLYMTRKLFAFARGECAEESADNTMYQEVLLSGHLFCMFVKEKIHDWVRSLRMQVEKEAKLKDKAGNSYSVNDSSLQNTSRRVDAITRSVEYLMTTGNLISRTGLGLMQASGLTIVADKLNFLRYISHFRCIHRGSFFAEMRTTAVRKMLPESWGFICPVHTPDGTPCGLMNHMTALCQIINKLYSSIHLPKLLCSLGVTPLDAPPVGQYSDNYRVMVDGKVIGNIHNSLAEGVAQKIRVMKVEGLNKVPPVTEVGFVPKTEFASQYPGLYIFTTPARMMRPVRNLSLQKNEMVGTFEQVYMDISLNDEETHQNQKIVTHQELTEMAMLSTVACLTPFSDFNQSPRNIYQCQMGKQTMGTPCHALGHRSDNKLYRIQTPQTPMVRPYMYDYYNIDEYPVGTNAVVAVISYTGYDMEDAMILNKSSFERGFGHATVHKAEIINLAAKDRSSRGQNSSLVFGCKGDRKVTEGKLDVDGLPYIGAYLQDGDPYYSYYNLQTGESRVEMYKSAEPAHVDYIKILGNDLGTSELNKICIGLRIKRNPIIGDKFASRHGQKGICSMLWPVENMPFTESGMTPDILFNPHGFPSRMTIGMMIESMAGKSAASHGLCHDATPFKFSEDQPAIDYFGDILTKAGYNYYGTERMYSGSSGLELEADIFIGVVYYQRLRHMVSDKFQVRSTGPVDQLTHQPVKGRKRGGGIRFGEMERDGMIAHGTAFLLQDRLLNCSDKSMVHVCTECGSLLSPLLERPAAAVAAVTSEMRRKWTCMLCKRSDTINVITVPFVFRYLVAELAAINIKVQLEVK